MMETDTLKNVICAVRYRNKGYGNTEEEIPYFALDKLHGGCDIQVEFWRTRVYFFREREAFQSESRVYKVPNIGPGSTCLRNSPRCLEPSSTID